MKFRRVGTVGILSALWCWTAISSAAAQERFDLKVRTYFFAGFSGDADSLATGMKMCEESLSTDPKNAKALVWHGAGLYFQAGQAFQKNDQQQGMEWYQRTGCGSRSGLIATQCSLPPMSIPAAFGCTMSRA
ncbi:MAG: hypothetical protein M3Y27_12405, partial [Acidobacteriota bacterium]|nr:hypothetical protein [Acidobacteriota bacterium]